jgi:hypothetical protein
VAKLPHIDSAVVEDAKLTDYLLALHHPRGAAKARFLMSFGFSQDRPEALRAAFLAHAGQAEVVASQDTDFGTILEIEGPLPSPDGRNPAVRAVWFLDTGTVAPRLITMVPRTDGRKGRKE